MVPLLALGMAGEPPQPVRLTVCGPAAATWASLQRIDQTLALAGAALVLLAVALCWLQVRVGLAPLRRLEALLATIRNPGSAAQEGALVDVQAMLAAPTGRDLQPLQAELASLWEHNARVVARARAHALDLNHALKKPLALLSAQAGSDAAVPAADVQRQVKAMAQVIDRYQARTFSDALHMQAAMYPATVAQPVDIAKCVAEVVRMMERLHADQALEWTLQVQDGATPLWRGERTVLEEIRGNLLDNAGSGQPRPCTLVWRWKRAMPPSRRKWCCRLKMMGRAWRPTSCRPQACVKGLSVRVVLPGVQAAQRPRKA